MVKLKTGNLIRCLPLVLTVVLASMTISGCGGGGSTQTIPRIPNISVPQDQIDFSAVVLNKSADKNIEIRNTGNGNLTIGQISSPSNPYSVVNDGCSNSTVTPAHNCFLTIRFAPTVQGDYTDSLDIPSNDSDTGIFTATLSGMGRALNVSIKNVTMVDPTTVQVVVSVRDQFDDPVTTLTAGNFSIFETGAPGVILTVSNTISPPVSVGMALDYSSTMNIFNAAVEAAAKSFVDLLDPGTDEAEVIKFASRIEVKQTFTQDHVLLKNAIDDPYLPPNIGSYLFDACWASLNSISLRSNPRRAIIAVSDGNDTSPSKTISDVTAGAADNNVQIFTIGIGANVDNVTMQQLAADTGGQYFYTPSSSDLTTVYSTISQILSNEYTIEYTTSFSDGQTIFLEVEVTDSGQDGYHSKTVEL